MKELIELLAKTLDYLHSFLADILSLLARPKTFMATEATSPHGFAHGLMCLTTANVLAVILTYPFAWINEAVATRLALPVLTLYVFQILLSIAALNLAWKLAGGAAAPAQNATVFLYSFAPVALLFPVFLYITWALLYVTWSFGGGGYPSLAEGYNEPEAKLRAAVISFAIFCCPSYAWLIFTWGAYRTINGVSKARSIGAFLLATFLVILVNLILMWVSALFGLFFSVDGGAPSGGGPQ